MNSLLAKTIYKTIESSFLQCKQSLNEPAFPRALKEGCTESFLPTLNQKNKNYPHSQKKIFCLYWCKWCISCKFKHPSQSQINSQKFINSEDLFRSQTLEDRYILKIYFQNQMRPFSLQFWQNDNRWMLFFFCCFYSRHISFI